MLQSNILLIVLIVIGAVIVLLMAFGLGFGVGFSYRLIRKLNNLRVSDKSLKKLDEETPETIEVSEGAIADSSPEHLAKKRDERFRKGIEVIDEEESQIVNTKTPEQLEADAEVEKNKRLDKWMPDINHEE